MYQGLSPSGRAAETPVASRPVDANAVTVPDATRTATTWSIAKVDSSYENGAPSLKVDANGKVHIAYVSFLTGAGIYYATDVTGTWVTEEIMAGDFGNGPSLALDANGAAHIGFASGAEIYYATNATGTWITTSVAATQPNGPVSLALDATGKAYLVVPAILSGGGNETSCTPRTRVEPG